LLGATIFQLKVSGVARNLKEFARIAGTKRLKNAKSRKKTADVSDTGTNHCHFTLL
jgi:hypothetical protein